MFGFGKIAFETISTRSRGGYFLVNTSYITRTLSYTIGHKIQYIPLSTSYILSFGMSGLNTPRMTRTERCTRTLYTEHPYRYAQVGIMLLLLLVIYYNTTVMNETGEPTISCRAIIITVRRDPTPRAGRIRRRVCTVYYYRHRRRHDFRDFRICGGMTTVREQTVKRDRNGVCVMQVFSSLIYFRSFGFSKTILPSRAGMCYYHLSSQQSVVFYP